ncbi:hypothetical protein KIK84_01050 [Curvibacter sp. CHRR-16]|uniref:PulJ/GspJ family protein n=1 Tax=Curvibacter sp. CHRR-16 TaxID=2835872 RepID=UPI001BD94383|nr:hypothetical protein [Curvibacter sp. CHRR-16]MBT0568900.1 hypothetical protein [Curvibacter sp. CHRR-16]
MKPSLCNKPLSSQRGDALIEALVGMLLMSVISLGLAFVMTKTLNNQRNTSVGSRTLVEMRQVLSDTGVSTLCGSSGTAVSTSSQVAVTPTCSTIASVTVDPKKADGSSLGISGSVTNVTQLTSLATPTSGDDAGTTGISIAP